MDATRDIAKTEVGQNSASTDGVPEQRHREDQFAMQPLVDIFEDAHGIMVVAEMPGVSKDRLNVESDGNSLTIEGEAAIDIPQGMEPIHADVQHTRYSRSFVLSAELESDAIDAKLKDGVLTIRIPKRREFRPRRVEVRTD